MNKKLTALLMALILLLGLLAGCSKTESTAPGDEVPSPAAEPVPEAPAPAGEEAPATAAEPTAGEEPAPVAEPVEEAAVSGASAVAASSESDVGPVVNTAATIEYPIGDGSQRITLWAPLGRLSEFLPTQNDLRVLPLVLDATGATYEFVEVSESAATEQFSLMIASGDWTDLLNVQNLYTGGLPQAYEDSIILDLTDRLETNMPDYWAYVENLNKTSRETMTTEGMELGVWTIADTKFSDRGFAVRGDWLEELGLAIPTTISELTDSLNAMYEAYAPSTTLYMGADGALSYVAPAFDSTLPGASEGSSLYLYLQDGQVCTGYTSDGYRAYLEWFYNLYQKGIINSEFYNTSSDEGGLYGSVGAGQVGYFNTDAERLVMIPGYADANNQDLTVLPVATILADGATGNEWVDEVSYVETAYSITECCENVDFTLQFLNYFFTQPGWLLNNFGEEGFSWEYDENGNPRYNDMVLNNPDGIPTGACSQIYCLNAGPYYMSMRKMQVTWNDQQVGAVDVWTDVGKSLHSYPEGATLTTDETSAIVNYMNDCISAASEAILKFMTGAVDLTDESWATYCASLDGFGLRDCLDVYQTAYDQYTAGVR